MRRLFARLGVVGVASLDQQRTATFCAERSPGICTELRMGSVLFQVDTLGQRGNGPIFPLVCRKTFEADGEMRSAGNAALSSALSQIQAG